MRAFAISLAFLLLAGLALVLVHVLNPLPTLADRTHTTVITHTGGTRLGRATAQRVPANPAASGIYPLPNALEAFAARVLLASAAERSLDIQYYIWRNDMTGTMLFDALRAADRGVRVRLLLDDNKTAEIDAILAAVRDTPLVQGLLQGNVAYEWVPTRLVSDDPAKGLGRGAPEGMLMHKLREITGAPQSEPELVSPYFVPTAAGVEVFVAMANDSVQIRVLVNSLEATDVDVVHSGYAKRREPMLAAGIKLYEMRLVPPEDRRSAGAFGSGASSLHAKTFSADRKQVFIGSFNFDPRSANLNTELGFIIRSPALAARLAELFDNTVPAAAYEVHLSDSGDLYWTERINGQLVRHDTEPGTSFLQRASVAFMSLLPIEWLL